MNNGMFDLSDKVAIVTGGNRGIGLGMAKGLAGAGAKVAIAARSQAKIDEAVALLEDIGATAIGIAFDVTDESSVGETLRKVSDHYGRLDILVNNAGTSMRKEPQEFTVDDWNLVHDTNLKGTFFCAREAYPYLVKSGGGKVINIGSLFSIHGLEWGAPYAASKGGVVQLTRSLALAWAKDNIQVNAILPGWTDTDLTKPIKPNFPERYELITSRMPYGRWGRPDDYAGTAVFLASSASDYVTAAAIPVDGGFTSF